MTAMLRSLRFRHPRTLSSHMVAFSCSDAPSVDISCCARLLLVRGPLVIPVEQSLPAGAIGDAPPFDPFNRSSESANLRHCPSGKGQWTQSSAGEE